MPPRVKITKRWAEVNRAAEPSRERHGGGGADRLSALPDALLHHIMSFMKAWEVVRTCVLSRRWRDLWASAPCVDVRVGRYSDAPDEFPKFVYRLLLARESLAPVDTLRLRSPGVDDEEFDDDDVNMWIRHAIKRRARVIQLNGHLHMYAGLHHMDFVSCHLKILKLSYAVVLNDKVIRQLSSRCPSLEELELKSCLVGCREIASASLKILTMVKCQFTLNLSVDAPNLVSLQCTAPENWVPLFKNFGSLVTANVMLDDSLLSHEFRKYHGADEFSQTSDEDQTSDDNGSDNDYSKPASDDSDDGCSDYCNDDIKDDYDYGSDMNSDTDTYEYSEIANGYEDKQLGNCDDSDDCSKGSNYHRCSAKSVINDYKKLGGQNVLHSLSNARNLELFGHSGEVVLRRESISCPTFSILKTLALGEWCISTVAAFDILIRLLQHSPNLEKLFLQLKMSLDIQKALGRGIKEKGGDHLLANYLVW